MSTDKISKVETFSVPGFYLLFGEISNESSKEVIEWILNANSSDTKPKSLNLIINSAGGFVNDAFAIIDVMQGSHIPIHTTGLGEIMSSGLMIFLAGQPGHRTLTPNTSIMSHQFSAGAIGKDFELYAELKNFNLLRDRIFNHYQKCTSLTKKVLETTLFPQHDVYLSAEEALKLKLCDRVALK